MNIVLNSKGKLVMPFSSRDIRHNSSKKIMVLARSKPYVGEVGVYIDLFCYDENGQQFVVKLVKAFDPFDLGKPSYVFYNGLSVTVNTNGNTPNFWLENFQRKHKILELVLNIKFSVVNRKLKKFITENSSIVEDAYMDFQYEHCFKSDDSY